MVNKKEVTGIYLDKKTKEKLDMYARNHSLSRSAVIRLACNEFFIKGGLNESP